MTPLTTASSADPGQGRRPGRSRGTLGRYGVRRGSGERHRVHDGRVPGRLYVALQAQGHGRDGTQALIHALASLSGTTWGAYDLTMSGDITTERGLAVAEH